MSQPIAKAAKIGVQFSSLAAIFLFPLFFLPTTANFFETNKLSLLVAVTAFNLICWGIKTVAEKHSRFTTTPLTLPLVVLGLSTILSTIFSAGSLTESLMGRGGLYISLVVLSLTLTSTLSGRKFLGQALYALIGSATVLSFISIFQSLGFGLSTLLNKALGTTIPDNLSFTPAGSPLALLSFIAPILFLSLILAFQKKDLTEKVTLFVLSAVMTAGFALTLIYSLPGKNTAPIILSPQFGYIIAVETLKNPKTALLGYGPEQFMTAFNRTRPAGINLTTLWNIRFTGSSTEVFTLITTLGLIGFAAWIYLGYSAVRLSKVNLPSIEGKLVKFAAISLLFLQLLLPGSYPLIILSFFMLILWNLALKAAAAPVVHEYNLLPTKKGLQEITAETTNETSSTATLYAQVFGATLIMLAAAILFFAQRAYAGEFLFKKALDAAAKNDGTSTYNLQRDAILKNPYLSQYRRGYSATNLALANTISGKGNLSDQDKNNVAQLIQQSIREAKAAVALDPNNVANWESLIFVYRSLINVAQNADQWTVASYAQAIQNDPVNPRLRLEMGGVYYSLGQYDQAIRLFQQATELKPDWSNAYYNLAAAYREKGEHTTAYNYMKQVVALVQPDTADYTKAQQELQDLAKKANIKEQTQEGVPQTDLTTPSPAPSPNPKQQVKLPAEAGPDSVGAKAPASPAPTSTPKASPQP